MAPSVWCSPAKSNTVLGDLMSVKEQLHAIIDKMPLGIASDPKTMAEVFTEWDDEQQAQFFIEAARIMTQWGAGKHEMQAYYIGGHLKTCSCSTDEAREFVQAVADRLK